MQSPSRLGSPSVRRSKGIYKRNLVLEGEELPAIALEILSRKCLFPRQPPRDERKEAADIEVRKQFIGAPPGGVRPFFWNCEKLSSSWVEM